MIHVVRLFAVRQQFRNSFAVRSSGSVSQSVSCDSSAVHGSCRSFGSSCRSVSGSVGSVVQSVYAVCRFAVADQYYPAQSTKHVSRLLGFFTIGQGIYIA